jgi:hypothetical protein
MNYFLTAIVILFQLVVTAQSMDVDDYELYVLPIDVNQEIFSYLSPLELRSLRLTGNHQILRQLSIFTKMEVERALYQDASPELQAERRDLCDALPFAIDDYQSRYNLITRFDQIAEIIQGVVMDLHSHKFSAILRPSILDFIVSLNNDSAIRLKFFGFITGKHGYAKDHPQAHNFLLDQHHRGSPMASSLLYSGLLNGCYFIKSNHQEAWQLLNNKLSEGQVWALERQYNLIKNGWRLSDPKDLQAALHFLLYHVKALNIWAVQMFFNLMNDYQHKDTPEFIDRTKQLITQFQERGYSWLKRAKLNALAKGYYPGEKAKDYLMDAVKRGERWAVRPYINSLKHGSYGINVNQEELQKLIEQGCKERDPLALREKYDIHHSSYSGFVWDPECGPQIRYIAIRLGESWAITEEINIQVNRSYHRDTVNSKLLEQIFDLRFVSSA